MYLIVIVLKALFYDLFYCINNISEIKDILIGEFTI